MLLALKYYRTDFGVMQARRLDPLYISHRHHRNEFG